MNIPSLLHLCIFQGYISVLHFSDISRELNGEHCTHSYICEYFRVVSVHGYSMIFHMCLLQDITEYLLVCVLGTCLCSKYISRKILKILLCVCNFFSGYEIYFIWTYWKYYFVCVNIFLDAKYILDGNISTCL